MPAHYDKDLTTQSAFNLASAMAWANVTHRNLTAYIGTPPFHLGAIEFRRTEDLKDRLVLAATAASVPLHGYNALLTPTFSYIAFKHGSDYLSMMSQIHDKQVATGSDLVVQVVNRDKNWHAVAQTIINNANNTLAKDGHPSIITKKIDDNRIDYIFPSIKEMKNFCLIIEKGSIDHLAAKHEPELVAPHAK